MTFDPNSDPNSYTGAPTASSPNASGTPSYLGGTNKMRVGSPVHIPFGNQGIQVTNPNAYVKGDQFRLLPSNGGDLAALQQALYQAGYLSDAQIKQMVAGSPDEVTSTAFAKLLATANMSGTDWKNALSARLAAGGAQAPATAKKPAVPPLTVSLTNPDDIKKVAQQAAQTLNGTYLDDASLNSFIASYHQQQTAEQTSAYNQQYNPNAQAGESAYGPGGTTVAAANSGGLDQQLQDQIRATKPNEVASNDFTANLNTILATLRQNSTGIKLS